MRVYFKVLSLIVSYPDIHFLYQPQPEENILVLLSYYVTFTFTRINLFRNYTLKKNVDTLQIYTYTECSYYARIQNPTEHRN